MRARARFAILLSMTIAVALPGCADDVGGSSDSTAPSADVGVGPITQGMPASPAVQGNSSATGVASSAPGAPIELSLRLEDARAFFGAGTRAYLSVRGMDTDALRAGIALPAGVELVEGRGAYEGALREGGSVLIEATLRAPQAGEHVLRAWAEAPLGEGSRAAPSALLGIRGGADAASFITVPAPAPAFALALTSTGGGEARVTITSMANASARLVYAIPDVFPDATRVRVQTMTLTQGEPFTRTIEIGEPQAWESGSVVVAAYLYPDPAVDGRLYSDALYYTWENGELRVSETAPSQGTAGGGTAPGAAAGDGGNGTAPAASP